MGSVSFSGALLLMTSSAVEHQCSCRANGRDYEQGQTACIRGKLALCGMQLNNSSWKITTEPCPESRLPVPFAPSLPLQVFLRSSLPTC